MHFPFTFAWVTPLVRRGLRTTLTQEDAAAAMAWAAPRTEALLAFYDGCEGTYRQRMWRLVRGRLATSALLYAAYCGTQLAQPLLLRGAVRAVQDADPDGWAYALAIGANVVLASLCKEQQLWTQMRLGAELRALSVALVYRRAMALRESAVPRGLSNLFGNDCQKLLDVMPLLHLVWAAPALIASAAALLVWLAGWAALAGIVLLSLSLPLNVRIVRATKAARAAQVPIADERVARAGEMVKGMRTLKLNSWDAGFEASVGALRERELPWIRAQLRLMASQMAMMIVLPQLATALALLATVVARPELPLTAELAFPVLSLMSIIRFPLFLGDELGLLAQAAVAVAVSIGTSRRLSTRHRWRREACSTTRPRTVPMSRRRMLRLSRAPSTCGGRRARTRWSAAAPPPRPPRGRPTSKCRSSRRRSPCAT